MPHLKRFISLLLVFSLTVPQGLMAQVDGTTDKGQNPPGTPEGVQCTIGGEKLPEKGVCCLGLEVNQGGICDEPPLNDPALTKCSADGDCTGGTGCYPQSTGVLFSSLSASEDEDLSEKRSSLDSQVQDFRPGKKAGETCFHPKECASYSCFDKKCVDKNSCRFAGEGESAGPTVVCGPGLTKNKSGICEKSPESENPVYLGLLKEPATISGDKCQFELNEETRQKAILAMRSLRAMEWFFATISLDQQDECFMVMPILKEGIGKAFLGPRKTILANFTEVLNGIDTDSKQVLEAAEKYKAAMQSNGQVDGSGKKITIHKVENMTEGDLGSRLTSGYDALVLMKRRNILFQDYEMAMLENVKSVNNLVSGLSQNMGSWYDGATSWNTGSMTMNSYSCEGSKYKKKKKWKWQTKYYEAIKDRWTHYYLVNGAATANADIIKRENVSRALALLRSGADEQEAVNGAIAEFTRFQYYLMDPLLFAGMRHGQFGTPKGLKSKGGFLGFSGFKDLRKAYSIPGMGSGSYTYMYEYLKPKLREYYTALKGDSKLSNFIYEPELVTTSAKDCLGADPKNCQDFQPFLDSVLDEAFAYFLAYSYYTTDSYEGFFTHAETYRRRLLAKLEVDMHNIQAYYEAIIERRNEQNACIDLLIGGVVKTGIYTNETSGLTEGSTGYIDPTKGGYNLNSANNKLNLKKGNLAALSRSTFSVNLRDGNLKNLSTGTKFDKVEIKSSSDIASASNTASASLAARADFMKKANQKAAAAGVKFASKDKAVNDLIKSMRGNSAMVSGGSGSGSSGSRGGFGFMQGGAAEVGKDGDGSSEATGKGIKGDKGEITLNPAKDAGDANANANADANPFAGITSGAGAGGDSSQGMMAGSGEGTPGANNDQNTKDGPGMSDEEKERLLAEYEKNKSDYRAHEDDGIFKKVSKAYVRNLDKVLIKKKKIEN